MKNASLSFIFFFALPLVLQAQLLPQPDQQARVLYDAGQYEEALEAALHNLSEVKKEEGINSESYCKVLRLLSLISYSSGLYDKGLDYAHQEVELRKRLAQKPGNSLADALHNLGFFQLRLNQIGSASTSTEEGLNIYETHQISPDGTYYRLKLLQARVLLRSDNFKNADAVLEDLLPSLKEDSVLSSLKGVALYLKYKTSKGLINDSEQAIRYLEQAYAILRDEVTHKKNVEELYQVTESLAYHYQQELQLSKAKALYLQLHQLFEDNTLKDSLRWSGVLNNLGVLTVKTNPADASKWLARSFDLQKKFTSVENNAFWSSLDNYAMSLHRQSQSDQALALYREYSARMSPDKKVCTAFATAMNNQAMILRSLGRTREALVCLYRAENLSKQRDQELNRNERLRLSTLYYNLAQTHQSLSQYDTAIYYYKKSTVESKLANATMSAEYLAAINGMAGLYHDIGYFTEADIFYSEALRIQKSLGGEDTNVYASILSNYALLQQDRGAYVEALGFFEEALDIKRRILGLDHPDYIAVIANIGLLYLEQANYEQARRMLETAFIKYENLYGKAHPRLAYALTNLARLEVAVGNYPEAEPLLKEALSVQKKNYGEYHPAYAMTAVEMGNFYMLLGNYEAAAPLLEQSRDLLKEKYGKTHPSYATAIQNLAILAEARGSLSLAEAYLLETLEIDKRTLGKQNPKYAVTLNNLASFYQNNDSLDKAMPLLQEALSICKNALAKNHPLYTSTLLNLALLYQDLQEYEKAAPLIHEVVRLRKDLLGDRHPDYAYALYGQAVNTYRLKKYEEALQLFQEVMQLYAWQIREYFPVLSEKEKSAFYQRIEPILNAYRDFVIVINLQDGAVSDEQRAGLVGSLYDLQLLTKAMLLDASSKIRSNIFRSESTQLIEIYEQWHDLKEQLAKYYALSEQELQNRSIDISELEDKANDLEKKLSGGSRIFARSLANQDIGWKEVKNRLAANEAAIEIIRVKNEASQQIFYMALVLDSLKEFPQLVFLPNGEAMESKNYNYYKNAVAYRIEDELSYKMYWKPINDALSKGVNRVYAAPDGVYNKISINSLYNTEDHTFVLDEIDLRMLSSTRELLEDQTAESEEKGRPVAFLLGFPDYASSASSILPDTVDSSYIAEEISLEPGETASLQQDGYDFRPLPGTQKEVNYIENLMQQSDWRIEKLTGTEASEEKIKQMQLPDVLHVATHGYFLSDLKANRSQKAFGIHMQNVEANPLLRSGLLLAGAAQSKNYQDTLDVDAEDGILTAYEAMNLNLNGTELVVLSACETALGEVRNGEGVYGLQRAFLVAGARSVLMSLWKVSDESTTELIRLFYQNWLAGQDKFSALANAQRSIREKYEEPYHWAPFVLIGT